MLVFVFFGSARKSRGLCCELVFPSAGEGRGDRKGLDNETHTHTNNTALPRWGLTHKERHLLIFTYISKSGNMSLYYMKCCKIF